MQRSHGPHTSLSPHLSGRSAVCCTARPLALLATLAALGLAVHPAQAQTIDPFNEGSFSYTADGAGGSAGGDQSAANVAGGDRTVALYDPYGGTFTAALPGGGAGVTAGPGYNILNLGYGYRYNGGGSMAGSPSTALSLDLSGDTGLTFTFSNVTGGLHIIASLQDGNYQSLNNNGPNSFFVSSDGTYFLPFSDLSGSVNLADIDYIDLDLQPNGGASFTITNFGASGATAAPEPSSVAAFAFTGLFAAGLLLRARKRKAAVPD